ncbi:class I adenylate-forming enzyme family protein [Nocardioides sp.]|uniref:class I adenylate-forming enzyme family protein n=1 Tax=Nocardioides sp. TaxID=35761 RepID=UPI003D0B91B5
MADFSGVADLLGRAAAEHPDKRALVEGGGRTRTWGELDDDVHRFTAGLGAAGLVAGYRVMIVLGNRIEFVVAYLGILRSQTVAVPVNPRSSVDELNRMLADSGARMVIADPDTVLAVRAAVAQLPEEGLRPRVVVVGATLQPGERSWDHLVASHGAAIPEVRDSESLAALLYTSGTSGRPRAAMLSHRALLANVEQVAAIEPPMIGPQDIVLGVLPLFHVYGLNAMLGVVLRQGACLVLLERFDPQSALDLIAAEQCTVVPVAPPVFAHWLPIEDLGSRLGSVRLMLCGSAPLSPEVADRFTAATSIPVHQGYGLTEAAPVVTSTLCSDQVQSGSVGAALPGVSIRLVDDDGRAPEGGDPGEILIAGDNLFSGYWPDGTEGPDAEGWWATGDVGFLDPSGDLFLVDRIKELVIVSGFNVYPSEVEDVIREVDGVDGAAVIGVADELTGEAVVAYVTGADPDDHLVDLVRAHCAVRLARFKQPSRVELVEELPLTGTGKVQKGRLRAAERRRGVPLLEDE